MNRFPHDASYKLLLAHRELMTDLGQGYLHMALTGEIDWDSLELVSTEHVTSELRLRTNDLVWRLRRRSADGEGVEWVYIFAVLEFQSSPDPFMAVRMMTYMGALYEDYIAHEGLPQGEKLPVIFPMVIYNGRERWNSGCELEGVIQPSPPGLEEYRPTLRFKLLDAWRCGNARTRRNLAEAIFRIERSQSADAAGQVMDELIDKFAEGGYDTVDRSFATWLTAFMRNRYPNRRIPTFTSVKEARMQVLNDLIPWGEHQVERQAREAAAKAAAEAAAKATAEATAEGLAKGLAKGLAEGREQGLAEGLAEAQAKARKEMLPTLRRSLACRARDRFGERIAHLFSAEIESLEDPADFDRICDWLDTCESGESLLALVQAG